MAKHKHRMASRFLRYIQDTRREMAHVSWPTRTQTILFTVAVMFISIVVAVYLSVFDLAFTQGLKAALDYAPRFQQEQTSPIDVQIATTTGATSSDITITPIPTE